MFSSLRSLHAAVAVASCVHTKAQGMWVKEARGVWGVGGRGRWRGCCSLNGAIYIYLCALGLRRVDALQRMVSYRPLSPPPALFWRCSARIKIKIFIKYTKMLQVEKCNILWAQRICI